MSKILYTIFIFLFFAGCYTSTTSGGVVGENSRQLLLISSQQMDQSAAQAYADELKKARQTRALNTNPILTKRVKNIADRLIKQVGAFREDALSWDWQVNVIDSNQVNAWCMPGGKIAVYSAIVTKLNLTDGELAAVLGHEIAHALREHSRERASQDQLKQIGLLAVSKIAGLTQTQSKMLDLAAQYTISLPFSRANEVEADRIGTELMARAGYDPKEAVMVWEKMSKIDDSFMPAILSTHPSSKSRIADLKKIANKVMPLYLKTQKRG